MVTRTISGLALAATLALATAAAATTTHEQVDPPGTTGCGEQPEKSDRYPQATLAAAGTFSPALRRVKVPLRGVSQATRVTTRVYAANGRRIDSWPADTYSCAKPGPNNAAVAEVASRTVGATIRRRGRARVRIVTRLVNGNGRQTTLRRWVTIRRGTP